MRYIDTGTRNADHALASWLEGELTSEITELRCQSGFFSDTGLPPFVDTLERLAASDLPARFLIGSNDCGTIQGHVSTLVGLLALPRSNARLGVISFAGGFYHPPS